MVYTLMDHKLTSKNVPTQVEPRAAYESVVSLPSFEHFMASFYGL